MNVAVLLCSMRRDCPDLITYQRAWEPDCPFCDSYENGGSFVCSKTSHYLSIKWQATVHFYGPLFWTLVTPDLGCKAKLEVVCM